MATPDVISAIAQTFSVTANMYKSGRYSDLKITCQGRTFNVHRAVICLQSKPFAAMVDGEFKEAVSGVIDLSNDDVDVVEKMIEFMYFGNYSDGRDPNFVTAAKVTKQTTVVRKGAKRSSTVVASPATSESSPESALALLLNVRVYVLAELYDVPNLKELAKNKYEELVPAEWNGPSFVASLKLIYENTPESDRLLKDVATKAAAGHIKELVDRGEFVALCKENGEVALDVLKAAQVIVPVCCDNCGSLDFVRSRGYTCDSCTQLY